MLIELFDLIEEQIAVEFTGKINILSKVNKQLLGELIILDGKLIHVNYKDVIGEKSFVNICTDLELNIPIEFIVEPELVGKIKASISLEWSDLKSHIQEILTEIKNSLALKPPMHVKLMAKPEIISANLDITTAEFKVLCTMSDYHLVQDIYKNCPLLDYEITNALVSLRKKNALTVIGT